MNLEQELQAIKDRNVRVELDKSFSQSSRADCWLYTFNAFVADHL